MSNSEIKVVEVIEPPISVKLTNGVKGDQGKSIVSASFVDNDIVFINDENEEIVITGGKTALIGSSAYQVWLDEGNTGTVEDYLASLVGEQGEQGLSAYEVWLAQGNVGTEAQFLASLIGLPGEVSLAQLNAGLENIANGTGIHDDAIKLDNISNLNLLTDYTKDGSQTSLPVITKSKYQIEMNEKSDIYVTSGNIADLFKITNGTYVVNGVTVIVNLPNIKVNGTATSNTNFQLSENTGNNATLAQLMASTYKLPNMNLGLAIKLNSYVGTIAVYLRSKISGLILTMTQSATGNNSIAYNETTWGQLYLYLVSGTTYNYDINLCLSPVNTWTALNNNFASIPNTTILNTKKVRVDFNGGYLFSLSSGLAYGLKKTEFQREARNIVCFGDSLTQQGTYPEQASLLTGDNYIDVSQSGSPLAISGNSTYEAISVYNLIKSVISGDFTAPQNALNTIISGGADPSRQINLDTLKTINWSIVDSVVIFSGTNDFGGTAPIGTLGGTTEATFMYRMKSAISILLTKYPHLKINIITPIYRGDSESPNNTGNVLLDYVNAEIEVAQYFNLAILNLNKLSGINSITKTSMLSGDSVHPTTLGYSIIARKIAWFVYNN